MAYERYLRVLRRQWWLLAVIVALDLVVSGYLYAKSTRNAGYGACSTVFVADASAPGLISAPPTDLVAEGQLLAGETAANFFGDDLLDVAESQHVARFVAAAIANRHLPHTSLADINGAVGGSRRDRTVQLCVNNPDSASALAAAGALATAMTSQRGRFIGPGLARRTFVDVISDPSVAPISTRHDLTNFALRVILGILVALGMAFLWDALSTADGSGGDLQRPRAVS